jgi:AraC-like DNA-binding protein
VSVVCDTSSVPREDRAELWMSVSSEAFVPLECAPRDRLSFRGVLRATMVGPVALSRLEASPHTVTRTRSLAADTNGDRYKLSLLLNGSARIAQDGREAALRVGDLALYDCSRPYTIEAGEGFQMLVFMLPRTSVGLTPDRVARMTATRISGDSGVGWAVSPFLERLADLAIRDELPTPNARLVDSVVDVVESLCSSAIGADGSSRTELLLRARAFADAHLADPSLSPAAIAAAINVSRRYLHLLFEADGTTVSGWIRERRLERCRRDLRDPMHRDETVAGIGARWGLTNAAHLSRSFRDAFGVSPSEYRTLH